MKGISEITAVILILMIVIALAALAYTWFSGIYQSLLIPQKPLQQKIVESKINNESFIDMFCQNQQYELQSQCQPSNVIWRVSCQQNGNILWNKDINEIPDSTYLKELEVKCVQINLGMFVTTGTEKSCINESIMTKGDILKGDINRVIIPQEYKQCFVSINNNSYEYICSKSLHIGFKPLIKNFTIGRYFEEFAYDPSCPGIPCFKKLKWGIECRTETWINEEVCRDNWDKSFSNVYNEEWFKKYVFKDYFNYSIRICGAKSQKFYWGGEKFK